MSRPVLVICMGVSGCGKTTLARELSDRFGLDFFEADDFHSKKNKAHMARGEALTDAMREPWIESICQALSDNLESGRHCVLAYSGLRRDHRMRFRQLGFKTLFLHLQGSRDLISQRMERRQGHYMPASLLDSQFSSMDPPMDESDMVPVSIDAPMEAIVIEVSPRVMRLIEAR